MFGLKSLALGSATALLIAMGAPAANAATGVAYAAAATTTASAHSTDWSGWDVTGSTYTSVSAAWTVPTVTCAAGETSYSADWVGLDGDGSNSVEQTGTSSDCSSGTPTYSAWYEFYPAVAVSLTNTVKAGDKISASVVAVKGTDRFTLVVTDSTQRWTKTETGDSPSGTGASAEIIAEAPSGSERSDSVLPLADFKTVTFSDVLVNGSKLGAATGAGKIAMVDNYENPMATVSELTGSDRFTVTWVSSGNSIGTQQSSSGQGAAGSSGGFGWPGTQSGVGSSGWGDLGGWTDTIGEGYGGGYGGGGYGGGSSGAGGSADGSGVGQTYWQS